MQSQRFRRIAAALMGSALLLCGVATARAAEDAPPVGHYPLPEASDIVGHPRVVTASHDDTVVDIGLNHGIGFDAMRLANPTLNMWLPGEGTEVVVPTRFILPPGPREGVVINLAEKRLYYYPPTGEDEPARVETYPVGVGRMDWQTPLGTTTITTKIENPAWYPPQSIREERARTGKPALPRVVPAGPDNPLGDYAMLLDIPGYMIHGTNRPRGVGMQVSHGCIRMLPRDIDNLVHRLPDGTQVRIINQPVKLGWDNGLLYAQIYPPAEGESQAQEVSDALAAVNKAVKGKDFLVDYAHLMAELKSPSGRVTPLLLEGRPFPLPEPVPTFLDRVDAVQGLYDRLPGALAG
ncbi:L,D-transpeptidase family protein [Modicisalibacter tunisiensis]|nr:L,D-transpeptidase family protein [Modicisalibacter tunisiensis]